MEERRRRRVGAWVKHAAIIYIYIYIYNVCVCVWKRDR